MTVLYPARSLLETALFLLFATFLLLSIYCLFRARYMRVLSYVLPYIAVFLSLPSLFLADRIVGFDILDAFKLSLFSQTACIQSAVDVGHGAAFAVCVWHADNLSVTATLIIYDSSDEIALPAENRSSEWKEVASRRSLVGTLDFVARKMTVDHFYEVYFFES